MVAGPWLRSPSRAMEGHTTRAGDELRVDLTDPTGNKSVTLHLPFSMVGSKELRLRTRTAETALGHRARQAIKRSVDVVVSVAILLAAAPLMIPLAIAVKATSPGPVFFRHRRIGRDGMDLMVWKFRSMRDDVDADELARFIEADENRVGAPAYKSPNDPRLTSVGKFIRRTGMDELPQLFNVLAGSMSLVGPRPLVEEEMAVLGADEIRHRNSVRPGVTGLWQVFRKMETTFDERMRLDLLYVGCQSVWLDAYLIVMTPLALIRGERSF